MVGKVSVVIPFEETSKRANDVEVVEVLHQRSTDYVEVEVVGLGV